MQRNEIKCNEMHCTCVMCMCVCMCVCSMHVKDIYIYIYLCGWVDGSVDICMCICICVYIYRYYMRRIAKIYAYPIAPYCTSTSPPRLNGRHGKPAQKNKHIESLPKTKHIYLNAHPSINPPLYSHIIKSIDIYRYRYISLYSIYVYPYLG